jgi:hypothetical protein
MLQEDNRLAWEGTMAGVVRMAKFFMVVVVLAAGALAFWRWREPARRTWDSFGGLDEIMDSADRLMETAKPVKDLMTQVARLK